MDSKKYVCTGACLPTATFDTLEEAKAYAVENIRFGTLVSEEGSTETVYAPYGEWVSQIMRHAKAVADYVRDQEFCYGDAPINPAINHEAKLVSCDRFVGWVLYRLGYTDQPYKQGLCVSGPVMTNWCIDHNFERIGSVSELQPGDICFTKKNAVDCPGHTFLYAGTSENPENFYRYDCGRVERIRSTQPSCEPLTDAEFLYGYRIRPLGEFVTPGLSFLYNGVPFAELEKKEERIGDSIRWTLPDGLVLTSTLKKFPKQRVYWWVNHWENPTDHDSGTVSELWDCDVELPFAPDPKPTRKDRQDTWEPTTLRVFETKGADVVQDDYAPSYTRLWEGDTLESACAAGRSGYGKSPYFDINRNECGVLMGVGWTGQWNVKIDRLEQSVRIRSGIQYAREGFYVKPKESFRTCSTAMMTYYRGQDEAHNRWRSFMREISPVGPGKPRGEQSPFAAIFWGGVSTASMLERWRGIFEQGFPFDTCWVDAGWYEPLCSTTTATQSQDWPNIGTWEVSRFYHPDGYQDLIQYLHEHNVGFMLWFEPERVRKQHSDWVETLPPLKEGEENLLVAMNKDEACDAVIKKVSEKVRELQLSVYRQDLNILPLDIWLNADEPGRRGMTEIRYINNLYRFWDALLEQFPNLLIDNCAGGGHRNDIEMLSRSVPMWRSDYQCKWDCCPEANQMQNQAAAWWMPYAGIGYGPTLGDTYSFRSAYCNGMTIRTWEHVDPEWDVGATNEPMEWARKYFAEYQSIRHYFAQDYYPLVPFSKENGTWSASQYHDPDTQSGVILAFRRGASPFSELTAKLSGMFLWGKYHVTNMDTGESFDTTGYELETKGIRLQIDEPRQSQLWRYEWRI